MQIPVTELHEAGEHQLLALESRASPTVGVGVSAKGEPRRCEGSRTARPSGRYTAEEKTQAVGMVRALRSELGTTKGTAQRVARQLGYEVESMRLWVKPAEIDHGEKPGTTTSDGERIKQLSGRAVSCEVPTRS